MSDMDFGMRVSYTSYTGKWTQNWREKELHIPFLNLLFVGRDKPGIGEEEFYILSPGLLFVGRDKPRIGEEEFYILSPNEKETQSGIST